MESHRQAQSPEEIIVTCIRNNRYIVTGGCGSSDVIFEKSEHSHLARDHVTQA
jgi:hypothetical protein